MQYTAECYQIFVLLVLEEKIITFVKNELKRFKRMLTPDYKENFESKEKDESEAREGALKMALHFLRNMEQQDLTDKLEESKNSSFIYIYIFLH